MAALRFGRFVFLALFCLVGGGGQIEAAEVVVPALSLTGADGKSYQPLELGTKKASVLFFISPFCPTSNNFLPEMNAIVKEYGDRVAFHFVEVEPGLQLADVLRHIEISGMTAPVLIDEGLKLAKQVAATTTPEAILLGPGAQKLYQGRINDFYLTPTRKQRQPTTRELRDALDAVLAGKAVANASVPAAGCKISGLE